MISLSLYKQDNFPFSDFKEIILNIEGIKYKGKGYIIPPRKLVKESLIKII